MTAVSRLCLVLALAVVVSRPSATIRTGSPDSGWWGTKEAKQLQGSARKLIQTGNYPAAEKVFADGVLQAKQRRDRIATARLLSGVGGARMARFDYLGALSAYLEAKHTAEDAADWMDLGAIDLNLSNLYEQVWDLTAALSAAEEGQAASSKGKAYYQAELLLQIARLHAERRDRDPILFIADAIEAARAEEQASVEARAWSLLGRQRLAAGDTQKAEESFVRAYYLRHLSVRRDEGLSFLDLGAVRLAQAGAAPDSLKAALLNDAERFTSRVSADDSRIVSFQWRQQRGRILLLQGHVEGALRELSAAVNLAERWRGSMATAELQEQVLAEFVQAAADYGLKIANSDWIEASFLAAETLRASNLRDSPSLIEAWRRRLPPRFWSVLTELRAEQARLRSSRLENSLESDRLQLEMISMEAEAGLGVNLQKNSENFRFQASLTHYQSVLSNSAVFLSFALGDRESFLWAVAPKSLSLYRLPPKKEIAKLVWEFRDALQAGRPEAQGLGKELYTVLFGQLKPGEAGKRDWLVSPADELLQLPFAALRTAFSSAHKPVYLAELHSVQIVSGPLLVAASSEVGRNRSFLGVGDPIYNSADSRWTGSRSWLSGWFTASTYAQSQLNRLPGSGREVDDSASGWPNATVLKGPNATKERFLKELSQQPGIIHLATHVLTAEGRANESFVAFSLGSSGQPELLGTADIAMLRASNALVVMTGCQTAGGDLRASVGLENLARAWTLSGARAVVATQWPVKDSGNEFLARFYERVYDDGPAEALRTAQAASIQSGAAPAVWASYQVYSNQPDEGLR